MSAGGIGSETDGGLIAASPAAWAIADTLARAPRKRVSAMMRVRNEEEFLAAAVESIADLVDEVVIVDNGSTDGTSEVIRSLIAAHPEVRGFAFPQRVARPGQENLDTVRNGNPAGLVRLSTYCNFALSKCRHPFVLKWDGDAIAGPELRAAWERWRAGPYLTMRLLGLNAHPDRTHALAPCTTDPDELAGMLAAAMVPGWAVEMTHTDFETWLFPRFLASYGDRLCWWCENLDSPFVLWGPRWGHPAEPYCLDVVDPVYLHVKYCKRSPHTNHSPDLARMIDANLARGPVLDESWRQILESHEPIGG